jgi:hypothetical protein
MRRWFDLTAALFCLLLVAFLVWRAALPNNRFRPSRDHFTITSEEGRYYVPRALHDYDDSVTLVTAHNFVRHGFLRTHLLPNRSGAPGVSFFGQTQNWCEQILPRSAIQYRDPDGRWAPMLSLTGDCVYTHYPPLADWFYATMTWLGAGQLLHFKIAAVLLNALFLVSLFCWLAREVRRGAALVATVLVGSVPSFLCWADALYYQPFQFLFLMLGLLSWTTWLRNAQKRAFALTWLLFLCEALASYELTLFFGLVLVGMTWVEHGRDGVRLHWKACALQGLAPVVAFSLQVALSASLFGLSRTQANLATTIADRMTRGLPEGLGLLLSRAGTEMVPWWVIGCGLLLVVFVRRQTRAPLVRPLLVGLVLLVGGASFSAAMPGTASRHHWMMHRHFLPFMAYSAALIADAALRAFDRLREEPAVSGYRRGAMACCAILAGLGLGTVLERNVAYAANEVRGNLASNRRYDPRNLVLRALQVLYWTEDGSRAPSLWYLPVSGLRVNEPRRWVTDFRIVGPGPSHYEVWWLRPETVGEIRVLIDENQWPAFLEDCFLSTFSQGGFERLPADSRLSVAPFVPDPTERKPRTPYAWVTYAPPAPRATRAIRLTCRGLKSLALRQLEAFPR